MAHVEPSMPALLGRMMALAPSWRWSRAAKPSIRKGVFASVNTGTEGGQEVHHLHIHVMGGPRPGHV